MTTVSSTGSTSSTSSTSSAKTLTTLDASEMQDRFLKLLVAQLNNQDPMNPMDNAQMTSQMAQINTVTGISQLNETMKSMSSQFMSMQILQGANMIGHQVMLAGDTLSVNKGVAAGAVELSSSASSVTIELRTPGGQVIDTFDLGAFRAMIERLRRRDEPVVYAPSYRRGLEDPIASAIPVARDIPIVITEGNYLLADAPELLTARAQLDEVWYLDTSDSVRLPQLIARHVAYGMGADTATAWASGPDQRNAELIESTRHRADLVITIERSDVADASSTNGHTPRTA